MRGTSNPSSHCFRPSRTLLSRQARDLYHWPDLDGTLARRGNPCGDGDSLVEILGLDEEVAAQLFARLRERTVGHEPFAVAHPNTCRHCCRVQRVRGQILSVEVNLVGELRGLRVTLLPLGLAQRLLVMVNQQHIFHVDASVTLG